MNKEYLYIVNKERKEFYKAKIIKITEKNIKINCYVTNLTTNKIECFYLQYIHQSYIGKNDYLLANIISFDFNICKNLMNEYIQEQTKIFEELKQVQDQEV